MKFLNDWKIIILLCVMPGLLPILPEPHIWGKLKWIAGGAVGMSAVDWFDAIFHGFPWILLVRLLVVKVMDLKKTISTKES